MIFIHLIHFFFKQRKDMYWEARMTTGEDHLQNHCHEIIPEKMFGL